MKSLAQSLMQKKINLFLFIALISSFSVKGQRHEIGVQLGISNLVGDIGRTNYILQQPILSNISDYGIPFYASVMYRMNFNPYQTVRINFGYSNVQFVDAYAKEPYRRNRQLWGTNSILELDAIFEYNFFPVNDEQKDLISPYVFGGFGGIMANAPQLAIVNDFNRDADGNALVPTSPTDFQTKGVYTSVKKITMAIPFGIGLKYKFNYNWAIFGEFMFRPTFSDTIDYSVVDNEDVKITFNKDHLAPDGKNSLLQTGPYAPIAAQRAGEIIKDRQIGNTNSKDWVNTFSVGLSYSFGRPPCYCSQ
ncbi:MULTISPECIES: type IX secretion system protein PorG [Chryseobacterium]|uniref:type IX secretion system protein PorG n=1 Tax=Chryseobacterium sp. R2A-55 TaxID=2744445 RepID=UPI00293E988B|nr:DUF6089 family protein [Chryseobacterium sp. R2A-55]